jgi:hypothetical protein
MAFLKFGLPQISCWIKSHCDELVKLLLAFSHASHHAQAYRTKAQVIVRFHCCSGGKGRQESTVWFPNRLFHIFEFTAMGAWLGLDPFLYSHWGRSETRNMCAQKLKTNLINGKNKMQRRSVDGGFKWSWQRTLLPVHRYEDIITHNITSSSCNHHPKEHRFSQKF